MPQPEPYTSLLRLAELERSRSRTKKPDPAVESDIKALLSRPPAPVSSLTAQQRESLTGARIKCLRNVLLEWLPDWLDEYAATAVVSLPTPEKRLRTLMLDILVRDGSNAAHVCELIAKQLEALPVKERKSRAAVVLDRLGQCKWPEISGTPGDFEAAINRFLHSAGAPATPLQFATAAVHAAHILKALFPGKAHLLKTADAKEPQQQVMPLFGDQFRKLLVRRSWGAYADEIGAVLWHQFWTQIRGSAAPAAPPNGALSQQALIQEAAWHEADEAIAHALQDIGSLTRSFERLEAVATGDAAARAKSALGASKMVIQWVRQAARVRNIALLCPVGEQTAFDPVFHVSDDASLGDHVRVRKPPVVRTTGSREAVLLRGEVELD